MSLIPSQTDTNLSTPRLQRILTKLLLEEMCAEAPERLRKVFVIGLRGFLTFLTLLTVSLYSKEQKSLQ